jgi:protein SDA1
MLNMHDKKFTLDHKILIMQLLSRVMGAHKLCVLGFYTYIMKYLVYRQLRVPSILVALAQSVHDLIPPDAITPVIRKIAQEFVHPGVASEVIAAGINCIREVSRRQPWAMEEDLLGDLVEYKKSKDKAVTSAAQGLLKLYREVNPNMLKRRERVRVHSCWCSFLIDFALSGKRSQPFNSRRERTAALWPCCRGCNRYRRSISKISNFPHRVLA